MKTTMKTGPVRKVLMASAVVLSMHALSPMAEANFGSKKAAPVNVYVQKADQIPAYNSQSGPSNIAVADSTKQAINQVIQIINMNQGNEAVVKKYKAKLVVLVKLAKERNVKLDMTNSLIGEALKTLQSIEAKVDALQQGQGQENATLKQIENDLSNMVNQNAIKKFFVDIYNALGTLGGIILGAALVAGGVLLGRGIRRHNRRVHQAEQNLAAIARNAAQIAATSGQSERRLGRVEGRVHQMSRDVRTLRNATNMLVTAVTAPVAPAAPAPKARKTPKAPTTP